MSAVQEGPVAAETREVSNRNGSSAGDHSPESYRGIRDFLRSLSEPVDSASLSVFRVALGIAVACFAWKTMTTPIIVNDFIKPQFHLTYLGFEWVKPWPGEGMYALFAAMFASGVGVATGVCYRLSAAVLLYTFTHAFLIERTLYNNHYYLIILLSLIANVIPLHRGWSVSSAMHPERYRATFPGWMLQLVRFQIGVVYFYGGIAKLDGDWLRGQPMGMWLDEQTGMPILGPWLGLSFMPMLFSVAGLLIDLLAVPLLCWKRTRIWMYAVLVMFHLLNSTIFTIGFFPWLMIVETLIFFPPDWPRKLFGIPGAVSVQSAVSVQRVSTQLAKSVGIRRRILAAGIGLYVVIQVIVPFRHLLVPGNASWTEYGQLFSWRMMLRQKLTGMRFLATDPKTGESQEIDIREYLTPRQAMQMSRDPDLIVQFAGLLAEDYRRRGVPDMQIRAKVLASLNGRRPQLLIDPEVDLAQERRSVLPLRWVMPLTEAFRAEPWSYPAAEWEERIASTSATEPAKYSLIEGAGEGGP